MYLFLFASLMQRVMHKATIPGQAAKMLMPTALGYFWKALWKRQKTCNQTLHPV